MRRSSNCSRVYVDRHCPDSAATTPNATGLQPFYNRSPSHSEAMGHAYVNEAEIGLLPQKRCTHNCAPRQHSSARSTTEPARVPLVPIADHRSANPNTANHNAEHNGTTRCRR